MTYTRTKALQYSNDIAHGWVSYSSLAFLGDIYHIFSAVRIYQIAAPWERECLLLVLLIPGEAGKVLGKPIVDMQC